MIKWLCYIFLLLALVPLLSVASVKKSERYAFLNRYTLGLPRYSQTQRDTIINKRFQKQREEDEANKIKEIAKAKKQYKPEKVGEPAKKRRHQRPEGMERPPEIIRRNGG
ncbi:hypothetical protein EOD41_12270 [Mucilaginibacter limnophilus]|uniref:Uncharacterized protein n=1 Tax=Mucilaginibacter limnophilus TaxID=1932778 RepID=A0A437MRJ4_9SPHI|nr:hypothetical protein [Mucilaginibacter limnophilus]RVU00253.1 hypothetical protein EOD41_12270 [Mucilaginibacter limnophilus]